MKAIGIPYHPKDKAQIHFEKPYDVQTIHCIEFFWYKLNLHKTLESFLLSGSPKNISQLLIAINNTLCPYVASINFIILIVFNKNSL
jgi:hypothetical protein